MNEWWLIGLLTGITVLTGVFIMYPLRRYRTLSSVVTLLFLLLIGGGYYCWGDFGEWQHYNQQKVAQAQIKQMLQTIKSPQELINKLIAKLDASPSSAKGWYLLGRLYTSQNDNKQAAEAFAKAHQLRPKDEQFSVNYAHSLWELNHQEFSPEIVAIFDDLLKNNPKQPDALAMLAMNAFLSHAYEDAISYWQRLLQLAPEQSPEAKAIRKAIAKAQDHINLQRSHND